MPTSFIILFLFMFWIIHETVNMNSSFFFINRFYLHCECGWLNFCVLLLQARWMADGVLRKGRNRVTSLDLTWSGPDSRNSKLLQRCLKKKENHLAADFRLVSMSPYIFLLMFFFFQLCGGYRLGRTVVCSIYIYIYFF